MIGGVCVNNGIREIVSHILRPWLCNMPLYMVYIRFWGLAFFVSQNMSELMVFRSTGAVAFSEFRVCMWNQDCRRTPSQAFWGTFAEPGFQLGLEVCEVKTLRPHVAELQKSRPERTGKGSALSAGNAAMSSLERGSNWQMAASILFQAQGSDCRFRTLWPHL